MTARRVAELALDDIQTQALIGHDIGVARIAAGCFGLIAKYGNTIPDDEVLDVLGMVPRAIR